MNQEKRGDMIHQMNLRPILHLHRKKNLPQIQTQVMKVMILVLDIKRKRDCKNITESKIIKIKRLVRSMMILIRIKIKVDIMVL